MKTKFLFTALIAALLTVSGCKKDDECTVKCLNGGVKTENCDCQCNFKYTGADCSRQKTPAFIIVDNVNIYNFPSTTAGGSSWDADGSAPDIYVTVYDVNDATALFTTSGNYLQNPQPLTGGQYYSWPVSSLGVAFNPLHTYLVQVYDEDIGTDQLIAEMAFEPYDNKNRFPATIYAENTDAYVEFAVSYQW